MPGKRHLDKGVAGAGRPPSLLVLVWYKESFSLHSLNYLHDLVGVAVVGVLHLGSKEGLEPFLSYYPS